MMLHAERLIPLIEPEQPEVGNLYKSFFSYLVNEDNMKLNYFTMFRIYATPVRFQQNPLEIC